MNREWSRAKAQYEEIPVPQELPFALAGAVREGDRVRKGRSRLKKRVCAALSACACFVLLVNVSPAFAAVLADVPLIGTLARIVTIQQYKVDDRDHLIDVRLPAVENTGHTDLEQRINTEIQQRIQTILDEAEEQARLNREAFVATGGEAEDFIPIIIDVDYTISCQSGHYLSFQVITTQTQATAYQQIFPYTIDLETGRTLTLQDLLGPEYKAVADRAIRAEMARREAADPDNLYFDGTDGIEGFQGIGPDQKFYLNERENPVLLFEKYEIAPGYMGVQEFEIQAPRSPAP